MTTKDRETRGSATRAVRAGIATDGEWGAVVPPIHPSSTFTYDGLDGKRRYDYTRSGNPTRDLLGDAIAGLEGGAGSVITSSGMSAVALVLHLLEPGQLLIAPHDCYGGTIRLMKALSERGHFDLLFVDQTDEVALAAAFARRPRICWVETPSNPLLRITDLERIRESCVTTDALFVADNTFLSPALQKPIRFGADIVVHSTTKYLNGHSDVVGGAVIAADPALLELLVWWANCVGITASPFDSWLALRGLRTLHARMRTHEENAQAVIDALLGSDAVRVVHYPGLPHHPGHALARRQQTGFGGMVSFELDGGADALHAFLDGLELFSLAVSLGGVESLVTHPATMTHSAMEPEARARAGLSDSLLRLSVGIEDAADLVVDIAAGLERAARVTATGSVATGGYR
jgi:cystathionine gamma-synthase